jgi:hypothetical protein
MKWWLLAGLAWLGFGLTDNRGTPPPARSARTPRWQTDYAAARQAARQSGKPIFVVFR